MKQPKIIEEFGEPIEFVYHGQRRRVTGAAVRVTEEGNHQIAGRQTKKGARRTNVVRVYRMDRIEGDVIHPDA